MLTTICNTPSNIMALVVLFLKIKQGEGKKIESRKQENSPYSMQHLLPKFPATNRNYNFY
jgi:hypothetical protein